MDILVFFKQLAEIGITPPALIALGFVWQINKNFHLTDKRLAIIESKMGIK